MYICIECGEVFSEPDAHIEHHPYGKGYATESWAICPHCRSTNFEEAKECSRCGEYVAELEDDLCDVCHGDMYGEEE